MKLNYNIIWVEDKLDTRPYIAIKNDLKNFIESEFFDCQIQEADDFDEFKALFKDNQSYDLIITDLSLNNGSTGKQVIDYIRENRHNHTEIFFYSANTQLRQKELANSNRITFYQLTEGNYNELRDEIKELVSLTIAKFHHIVSMRGMIMHETSLLDSKMLEVIIQSLDKTTINFDDLAISIYDQITQLYETKTKFVKDCKDKSKFKALTKDNFVYSSDYKIQTLKKIIEVLAVIEDFSDKYKEDVINVRNKFAHAVLLKDEETGREYFKYKEEGITFDEAYCREIRNNIRTHQKNLQTLEESLKAKA